MAKTGLDRSAVLPEALVCIPMTSTLSVFLARQAQVLPLAPRRQLLGCRQQHRLDQALQRPLLPLQLHQRRQSDRERQHTPVTPLLELRLGPIPFMPLKSALWQFQA